MSDPVSERVISIASDVFEVPKGTITANSAPDNVESWDSTRHLNFILALEERFQFQLSPEETERIRNIRHAIELVEEKLRGAGS